MPTSINSMRDLIAAAHGRRLDLGLTQAELARRAGVSRQWINEFEQGKPTAELGLVLRLLDALELELAIGERGVRWPWARQDISLDDLLDAHRGP